MVSRRDVGGQNCNNGVLQLLWDGGQAGTMKIDVVCAANLNLQRLCMPFPLVALPTNIIITIWPVKGTAGIQFVGLHYLGRKFVQEGF